MRRPVHLLCAVALAGLFTVPAGAGALTGVLHDPPTGLHAERAASFEVVLEGVGKDDPKVVLHYRTQGSGKFQNRSLHALGGGRYRTEIPGAEVRGLALVYYIEIDHDTGAYHSRLGSPENPISVALLSPEEERSSDWVHELAVIVLAVGFVGGAVSAQVRKRRNRVLDQLFWARQIGPLSRLRGQAARERAEKLAGATLDHPVAGLRTFSRDEILAKLGEVQKLDPDELRRAGERLGERNRPRQERESLSAQVIADGVGPLAADVGRLCAAAWFLSNVHSADPSSVHRFLEPFEEARRDVRNLQQAMERKQLDQASLLLEKLTRRCRGLRELIAQADFECPAEELARLLGDSVSITADTIGSILEYYALVAKRSNEVRKKLLVTARALARHDGLVGGSPARVRDALRRRRLMRTASTANEPKAAVCESARELRARIGALEETADTDLSSIRSEVEQFVEGLDSSVFTIAGLAEAVAVELALQHKSAAVDRCKAGSFDSLMSDLASVAQSGQDEDDDADTDDDHADAEALALLRETEAELQESLKNGDTDERDFYLDATEQIAACNENPVDAAWASLVLRSAACRTAADRFARKYAKSYQPEGQAPPPLPTATAETLLDRCRQHGRDLQDAVERDLMRGQTGRAKDTTRLLHRLNRSKTGLALLAKLPVDG